MKVYRFLLVMMTRRVITVLRSLNIGFEERARSSRSSNDDTVNLQNKEEEMRVEQVE